MSVMDASYVSLYMHAQLAITPGWGLTHACARAIGGGGDCDPTVVPYLQPQKWWG
jgi:hypothetical protein